MAVGLHVADNGFDSRAAAQFALDDAEDATLLTGDEDAARIGCVVTAVALVDIGALDCAAGELLGGIDDDSERVAVIRVARQRLGIPPKSSSVRSISARCWTLSATARRISVAYKGFPPLAVHTAS